MASGKIFSAAEGGRSRNAPEDAMLGNATLLRSQAHQFPGSVCFSGYRCQPLAGYGVCTKVGSSVGVGVSRGSSVGSSVGDGSSVGGGVPVAGL